MNKFKNATKKIVAVATSAALISSGAFATSLGDYPTNFVNNGAFNGQVVIGAAANGADSAAAASIISDLKTNFASTSDKVKITYKPKASSSSTTTNSGSSIDLVSGSSELNYGEYVGNVTKSSSTLKNSDNLAILQDETFRNGVGDQTFKQTLGIKNGIFNHQVHSTATEPGSTARQSEISDNIYYPAQTTFASYQLKLDSPVDFSGSTNSKSDYIGKTLRVMNNDYTLISATPSTKTFSKITLLGGANTVNLEGGKTVTVQGHRISLGAVDSNQAQVIVDGDARTIDKYSTDVVGGLNIGVLSVFPIVSGYAGSANIVVGGQKIEINGGTVKLNGQNVNTYNNDYTATATILGSTSTGFQGFKIDLKANHDMVLQAGDSLVDPVFGGFSVKFDGTNNPTYKDLTVSSNGNSVHVAGTTASGEGFSHDLLTGTLTSAGNPVYVQGTSVGDRLFTKNSNGNVNIGADVYHSSIILDTDLKLTAKSAGTAGSGVTYERVLGTSAISVASKAIKVTEPAGTSNSVIATKINGYPAASALVTATGGSTTSGSTMAATALSTVTGTAATKVFTGLTLTAQKTGTNGNLITYQRVIGATAAILVIGNAIKVTEPASTAASVIATLINGNAAASALVTASGDTITTGTTLSATALITGAASTSFGLDLTNTNVLGDGFLLQKDVNEQYFYTISNVDTSTSAPADHKVSFNDLVYNSPLNDIVGSGWGSDLGTNLIEKYVNPIETVDFSSLGNQIAFDNNLLLNFMPNSETTALANADKVSLNFTLDANDINGDKPIDEKNYVSLDFSRDTTNNEFDVNTGSSTFTNSAGTIADAVANDYKVKEFVTSYGVKVTLENKDKTNAVISVPDKQLKANVKLVMGVSASATTSNDLMVTVDASQKDAKKAELIAAGNTIVNTETIAATSTSFDITAPVMDSSVTGMNDMIVVGGPAVNRVARDLLGITAYDVSKAGVNPGNGLVRYFSNSNSVLVYGYSAADTVAAANKLNAGQLSGTSVNTQ